MVGIVHAIGDFGIHLLRQGGQTLLHLTDLIVQLHAFQIAAGLVCNDAAMKLYRLGWINNAEYFHAATKYLQLADKATRTVLMLTERLDHHRGRGQQQIVVKHLTTVNADQAVIAESIMTGKTASKDTPRLAAGADRTMQIIESSQKETMPVGGGTKRK